jgi:hypothetical protein
LPLPPLPPLVLLPVLLYPPLLPPAELLVDDDDELEEGSKVRCDLSTLEPELVNTLFSSEPAELVAEPVFGFTGALELL